MDHQTYHPHHPAFFLLSPFLSSFPFFPSSPLPLPTLCATKGGKGVFYDSATPVEVVGKEENHVGFVVEVGMENIGHFNQRVVETFATGEEKGIHSLLELFQQDKD